MDALAQNENGPAGPKDRTGPGFLIKMDQACVRWFLERAQRTLRRWIIRKCVSVLTTILSNDVKPQRRGSGRGEVGLETQLAHQHIVKQLMMLVKTSAPKLDTHNNYVEDSNYISSHSKLITDNKTFASCCLSNKTQIKPNIVLTQGCHAPRLKMQDIRFNYCLLNCIII